MVNESLAHFLSFYQKKIKNKFYNSVLNKKRTAIFGAMFFAYLCPFSLIMASLITHNDLFLFKDMYQIQNLFMIDAYVALMAILFLNHKKEKRFFKNFKDDTLLFNQIDNINNSFNSDENKINQVFYHIRLIQLIFHLNQWKGLTHENQASNVFLNYWEDLDNKMKLQYQFNQQDIKNLFLFMEKHLDFIEKYKNISFNETQSIFFDMIECNLKTRASYHLHSIEQAQEKRKEEHLKSLKL